MHDFNIYQSTSDGNYLLGHQCYQCDPCSDDSGSYNVIDCNSAQEKCKLEVSREYQNIFQRQWLKASKPGILGA